MTQRLDRVGQLLGDGWREPDRKLDVQLALQMVRLRAEHVRSAHMISIAIMGSRTWSA